MKKLLICMVVALLAIVLVACGGENTTTTQGKTTTSPTATTTNPKDNGNTNPDQTNKPADSSTTPDQTNKPADSSSTPDQTNKPADSSSTPDTDTPENPGTPGVTSVQLNAVDGVLANGATGQGTYVNEMNTTNGGSVTFTLEGNYKGVWQMDVYSVTMDFSRAYNVSVNGEVQIVGCLDTGAWENVDEAKSCAIFAELVDGVNTIVVSAYTQYAPNFVGIELTKMAYNEEVGSSFTLNAYDDGQVALGATKTESETGNYVQNMGKANQGTLTFVLNGDYAGTWNLDVYSFGADGSRQTKITVNGVSTTVGCNNTGSWEDSSTAQANSTEITLVDGFNRIVISVGDSDWCPNYVEFVFTAIEEE